MFFKAKDLMTVGNIGGGVASVLIAMEGMGCRPEDVPTYVFWSGFAVLAAYFFDAFDGFVARALNQMNQFGAEFDNVADLIAYSVAPSFLLYLTFSRAVTLPGIEPGSALAMVVAIVMASTPILSGAIRFARFNVRKLDVPGFWIGFPRPASALLIVSLVNSHLFLHSGLVRWMSVALVLFLGYMGLSLHPYIGHHHRRFSWYLAIVLNLVWFSVVLAFVGGVFLEWFPPNLAFDWALIWLMCYLLIQWTDIPLQTRAEITRLTNDWNR